MCDTIEKLISAYSANPANKYLLVLWLWLFWPGAMFLVGWIFEGRLVPIWKHQSKMFFPGDLSFGIIMVAFAGVYSSIVKRTGTIMLEETANSMWIWGLALTISLTICFALHENEKDCYAKRALHSPTKIAHDLVGYILIPYMLLALSTITVVTIWRYCSLAQSVMPGSVLKNLGALWQLSWPHWIAIALAMALYIGCMIYDNTHPATPEDIIARHPADWMPIWHHK